MNIILSLESSEQNAVFDGYTERALPDGTLDKGLENFRTPMGGGSTISCADVASTIVNSHSGRLTFNARSIAVSAKTV